MKMRTKENTVNPQINVRSSIFQIESFQQVQ